MIQVAVSQHSMLNRLTITARSDGAFGIYASHSAIKGNLKRRCSTAQQVVRCLDNWLVKGGAQEAAEMQQFWDKAKGGVAQAQSALHASNLVANLMQSHGDAITDLEATDVGDGFIYLTAMHTATGHSIERCYASLALAQADMREWVDRLSRLNTTQMAPPPVRDHGLRLKSRVTQPEYRDALRPSAMGRSSGPGRGHSKPKAQESSGNMMIDYLSARCNSLEEELAQCVEERDTAMGERDCLLKFQASVCDEVHPKPFETNESQRRQVLHDLVGDGYSQSELSSDIFRHITAVMQVIERKVGADPVKKMQLADRIAQRARGREATIDKQYHNMCQGIFKSLKQFLGDLTDTYKTRPTNQVRQIMQTVVTAMMADCDHSSQRYLAEQLEIDRHWLRDGKARAMTFHEEGLLDQIADTRGAERNDKLPQLWRNFCRDYWFRHCRPGEKMRDKMRHPKDRSDPELYDIYYRERMIADLYKGCSKDGLVEHPVQPIEDTDDLETRKVKKGFKVSERVFRDEKPFNIKDAKREQCLCIWHLRWEFLAEGFYNKWQTLRTDANTKCDCPHLKTGTALRRHLMCPRPEGATDDKIECVNQACSKCKDMKRLQICGKCLAAFDGQQFKYQIYGRREITKQRGRKAVDDDWTPSDSRISGEAAKSKPDFVLTETPFSTDNGEGLLDYMKEYWSTYIQHHDLSKHQDRDWENQRRYFPRGTFVSTQDYSENYHHQAKKEHQSAYFVEIGSTVYGMVIRVHLSDIGTEDELKARGVEPVVSDAQRVEINDLFEELGEPAIVTISHIVCSSDLVHDEAMVQHCNDCILMPWMEQIKATGVSWKRHHARSDGCKKQFKDGTQFWWISKYHERFGTHLEWNFFCRQVPTPCTDCRVMSLAVQLPWQRYIGPRYLLCTYYPLVMCCLLLLFCFAFALFAAYIIFTAYVVFTTHNYTICCACIVCCLYNICCLCSILCIYYLVRALIVCTTERALLVV